METISKSIPHESPEIFISYAWQDGETVADALDRFFRIHGKTILRDNREIGYKDSIREYMKRLGRGRYVILVLSDGYFKSKSCMFELLELSKHADFHDRIFPITVEGTSYDGEDILEYRKYWEDKKKKLQERMKEGDLDNLQGVNEDLNQYADYHKCIPQLLDFLRDINTRPLNGENFEPLLEKIQTQIEADQHTLKPYVIEDHTYTQRFNQARQYEKTGNFEKAIQCLLEAYDELLSFLQILEERHLESEDRTWNWEVEKQTRTDEILKAIFDNAKKIYATTDNAQKAQKGLDAYQKALDIDESFLPAIWEMANIYHTNVSGSQEIDEQYQQAASKYIECYAKDLKTDRFNNEYAPKAFKRIKQVEEHWWSGQNYENLAIFYKHFYDGLSFQEGDNQDTDSYDEIEDQQREILNSLCRIGDDFFEEKQNYSKARNFYKKVIQLSYDYQRAIYRIGECYFKEGKCKEAEDLLINYIKTGTVNYPQFEDSEKIEAFDQILDIENYYLAQIKDNSGSINKAYRIFRQLFDAKNVIDIENVDTYIEDALNNILEKLIEYAKIYGYSEAIKVAQKIRVYTKNKNSSYHDKVCLKLAELHALHDNFDKAIKLYQEIFSPYQDELNTYSQPRVEKKSKQRAVEMYPALIDAYHKTLETELYTLHGNLDDIYDKDILSSSYQKILESYSQSRTRDRFKQRAIEMYPALINFCHKRLEAELYRSCNHPDSAIELYQEILSPYQKILETYSQSKAEDELKKATEMYPKLIETYQTLLANEDWRS